MGCESDKVIQINRIKANNNNSPSIKMQLDINTNYNADNFKDLPEWEGERYRGIGIKKMKGYKCTLPIDELNKMREEFWAYMKSNNKIWKVIRQICIMDECKLSIITVLLIDRANAYLQQFKMKTADGCINHLVDERGNHFHIPNYCINDPYFEKELPGIDEKIEPKTLDVINIYLTSNNIKIVVYEASKNQNVKMNISNSTNGEEIKALFINESKINCTTDDLRLFFGGHEIKNQHILAQYNINNGYKIIAMKK